MTETHDGVHPGGSGDLLRVHAEGAGRARTALHVIVLLTFLLLGSVSLAAGEQLPWPLPPSAALPLKVSGLAAVATSLVILAAWGVHAVCAHVSARLSRWLERVRPAIAEMSVFIAAYLVAASQRRRSYPSEGGSQGLGDSVATSSPPPPFDRHDGCGNRAADVEGGVGGDSHRSTAAAGSWRLVAGVVFAPKLATAGGRTGGGRWGGVGPREVEMSTRASRAKGKKIVPTSP